MVARHAYTFRTGPTVEPGAAIGLFQVTASSSALYMPPLSTGIVTAAAEGWDAIGRLITPGLGGVVMVEAVKRLYASPGGGAVAPVVDRVRLAKPVRSSGRERH